MTNAFLTKKIIALHNNGYDTDFHFDGDNLLVCIQTGKYHHLTAVVFCLEDQQYDYLSRCFKYLHTIETYNGERGILLTDGILMLKDNTRHDDTSVSNRHTLYAII